jgi:hypothetical protein
LLRHVPQRVHKQLGNAQEKLERAQRHAEEKRQASQQTIERLQREYEKMDVERRENDKQVEELRMEAGDIESKASLISCSLSPSYPDRPLQMAEHLKRNEAELNELLMEYWKLRHETGNKTTLCLHSPLNNIPRGVHGNTCEQIEHECFFRLRSTPSVLGTHGNYNNLYLLFVKLHDQCTVIMR